MYFGVTGQVIYLAWECPWFGFAIFELCCLLNNYSERRDMLYDFKSLIAMAHLVCTIMPNVKWLSRNKNIRGRKLCELTALQPLIQNYCCMKRRFEVKFVNMVGGASKVEWKRPES